jgi:hypothetical protein
MGVPINNIINITLLYYNLYFVIHAVESVKCKVTAVHKCKVTAVTFLNMWCIILI